MNDQPIGERTTTFDHLCIQYPWLIDFLAKYVHKAFIEGWYSHKQYDCFGDWKMKNSKADIYTNKITECWKKKEDE